MKTTLLLFLCILLTSFAQAQTADLSMEKVFCKKTLIQSNPGMYMYMLEFDYTIKNVGTDSITPHDTLYVYWREDWNSSYTSFARIKLSNHILAPGDTMMRKKDQVMIAYPDPNMANTTFCMKINVSRDGTNRDNNAANDEYCESSSTGIADIDIQQLTPIYPNPVTDIITIDEQLKDITLEVFDVTGRRVVYEHMHSNNTLPVSQLSPGIYAYRIATVNNQGLSGKFIKKE